MAKYIGPKTEGGSGGRRGHSNMTHWSPTEDIKLEARRARRANGKKQIAEQVTEIEQDTQVLE